MDTVQQQLLHCLAAFARGESSTPIVPGFDRWDDLRTLSGHHKLEAVVYGTVGRTPGFCDNDSQKASQWRQRAYALSMQQSSKTAALLRLAAALNKSGLPYAVVKGVICRSLYANSDLRISADEDLYIRPEDYASAAAVLEKAGFFLKNGTPEDVTHWYDGASGLHIELHGRLLEDPAQEAVFSGFIPVPVTVEGATVYTLEPTLHLAFLLCHARKHLITGGVGIRTLCDIALFFKTYRQQLDMQELNRLLKQLHCASLLQHILAIGRDELGIECTDCTVPYRGEALLSDVLEAGIYGQSTLARRHSGTVTAQQISGKRSLLRTLFPHRAAMEARFPQLRQHPARLPLYWLKRLGSYAREVVTAKDNSPAESLQLGKQRMEMLVEYEIIETDSGKTS